MRGVVGFETAEAIGGPKKESKKVVSLDDNRRMVSKDPTDTVVNSFRETTCEKATIKYAK